MIVGPDKESNEQQRRKRYIEYLADKCQYHMGIRMGGCDCIISNELKAVNNAIIAALTSLTHSEQDWLCTYLNGYVEPNEQCVGVILSMFCKTPLTDDERQCLNAFYRRFENSNLIRTMQLVAYLDMKLSNTNDQYSQIPKLIMRMPDICIPALRDINDIASGQIGIAIAHDNISKLSETIQLVVPSRFMEAMGQLFDYIAEARFRATLPDKTEDPDKSPE